MGLTEHEIGVNIPLLEGHRLALFYVRRRMIERVRAWLHAWVIVFIGFVFYTYMCTHTTHTRFLTLPQAMALLRRRNPAAAAIGSPSSATANARIPSPHRSPSNLSSYSSGSRHPYQIASPAAQSKHGHGHGTGNNRAPSPISLPNHPRARSPHQALPTAPSPSPSSSSYAHHLLRRFPSPTPTPPVPPPTRAAPTPTRVIVGSPIRTAAIAASPKAAVPGSYAARYGAFMKQGSSQSNHSAVPFSPSAASVASISYASRQGQQQRSLLSPSSRAGSLASYKSYLSPTATSASRAAAAGGRLNSPSASSAVREKKIE